MSHVTVSFLNVGQGDCTVVIDHETNAALLIDCPRGSENVAIDEIREAGADLDTVVVTHSHLDHFGGVLDAIEALGCRRFLYNHDAIIAAPAIIESGGRRRPDPAILASLRRALEFGDDQLGPAGPAANGAVGAVAFTFVAPSHRDLTRALVTRNSNAASAVVLMEVDGVRILIGGDADAEVWRRLLNSNNLPEMFAVRWPHHGGDLDQTSAGLSAEILDRTDPTVVCVSVGGSNTYGHPSESFLTAVAPRRAALLCTQATGKCSDNNPEQCAASVRVHIHDGVPSTSPTLADHAVRVRLLRSPRCVA